ncbi:uncharacterized protein BDV14DRAFT_22114 [Aspergillus stella-maris]|uniref:uncharacterized protein n=1 Tax=Aspergillus stella-maris TaxID=1810926 RepID=UPI003CCDD466
MREKQTRSSLRPKKPDTLLSWGETRKERSEREVSVGLWEAPESLKGAAALSSFLLLSAFSLAPLNCLFLFFQSSLFLFTSSHYRDGCYLFFVIVLADGSKHNG